MENKAKRLMQIVKDAGYQIYIVGGSVRDSLLKRDIKDIDFVTNAHYQELLELFTSFNIEAAVIGAQFSVLQVFYQHQRFEIATFRTEKDFYNHRHPKTVEFVDSLYIDSKRRDFTINALAVDIDGRLYDFHHGKKDLENSIIRSIGKAADRFNEDALRMLRAIRFAVVLDFKIEDKTFAAIKDSAQLIKHVSSERIIQELKPVIESDRFYYGIRLLEDSGLLANLDHKLSQMKNYDQKSPYHHEDLWQHTLSVLKTSKKYQEDLNLNQKKILRLAALYHDIGKLDTQTIDESGIAHYYEHPKQSAEYVSKLFNSYAINKELTQSLVKIIHDHNDIIHAKDRHVFKFLVKRDYSLEEIEILLALQKADRRSHKNWSSTYETELDNFYCLFREAVENKPYKLEHLAINGNDVIEILGLKGAAVGKTLEELLRIVFYQPDLNEAKRLREILARKV